MNHVTPIEEAVNRAGGQTALALSIGVKQAHVWNWLHRGTPVTAELCKKIEALTGVPSHDLRPDVFGEAPSPAKSKKVRVG